MFRNLLYLMKFFCVAYLIASNNEKIKENPKKASKIIKKSIMGTLLFSIVKPPQAVKEGTLEITTIQILNHNQTYNQHFLVEWIIPQDKQQTQDFPHQLLGVHTQT